MTETSTAPVTTDNAAPEDEEFEEDAYDLEWAKSVLSTSDNPLIAVMWKKAGPAVERALEIQDAVRKTTVTDKAVREEIENSTDERITKVRDEIAKLRERLEKKVADLTAAVRAEMVGPTLSKEETDALRTEFAAHADVINTLTKGGLIMLDDEDSEEYHAVKVLAEEKPTLKGSGRKYAKVTGADQGTIVRQWARDNGYEVGDRGRIPGDVLEKFAQAHPNGVADFNQ